MWRARGAMMCWVWCIVLGVVGSGVWWWWWWSGGHYVCGLNFLCAGKTGPLTQQINYHIISGEEDQHSIFNASLPSHLLH